MIRAVLLLLSTLAVGLSLALGAALRADAGEPARVPSAGNPATVTIDVGDIIRVSGARIGCVVTRKAAKKVIDCRRAGELSGTYGTVISERNALVVRFEDTGRGKIVFSAKHKLKRARTCG
jgi:hypothetical protein